MTARKLLIQIGYHAVLIAGMILFANQPALSQEIVLDEEPFIEELSGDSELVEETTVRKFDDRERLVAILQGELDGDEENTDEPIVEEGVTDPDEPVVDNSTDPEEGTEPNEGSTETGQVNLFVDNLSDEQVFALNRSLNNVVNSGLEIDYDLELMQKIVDEDYNKQQINSLTQALEQEARFLSKYEETGNEKFLGLAERQKSKFLAKTEWFGGMSEMGMREVMKESRQAANLAVKEARMVARDATRDATKEARMAARDVAKSAVKSVAKGLAKDQAKGAIKLAKAEVSREIRRNNNKNKGKK